MTTQRDVKSIASVMIKEYGLDAPIRCKAKIDAYEERLANPSSFNQTESDKFMLEFYNSVYLVLKS